MNANRVCLLFVAHIVLDATRSFAGNTCRLLANRGVRSASRVLSAGACGRWGLADGEQKKDEKNAEHERMRRFCTFNIERNVLHARNIAITHTRHTLR